MENGFAKEFKHLHGVSFEDGLENTNTVVDEKWKDVHTIKQASKMINIKKFTDTI